jgi:hypothetical protein
MASPTSFTMMISSRTAIRAVSLQGHPCFQAIEDGGGLVAHDQGRRPEGPEVRPWIRILVL